MNITKTNVTKHWKVIKFQIWFRHVLLNEKPINTCSSLMVTLHQWGLSAPFCQNLNSFRKQKVYSLQHCKKKNSHWKHYSKCTCYTYMRTTLFDLFPSLRGNGYSVPKLRYLKLNLKLLFEFCFPTNITLWHTWSIGRTPTRGLNLDWNCDLKSCISKYKIARFIWV